jgi:Zn-dependent protease
MKEPLLSAKGISFRVLGFPVLYRWSALALPALFGFQFIDPTSGLRAIEGFLALALAIFAAVLVHELGHAVTSRSFGGTARIELVFLGGLTYHHYDKPLSNAQRALVSVAGSIAGAVAAGVVWVAFADAVANPTTVWESGIRFFVFAGLVWGVFNLVPLPGLDGSHILDAGVRAVAPRAAPVVVPVATAIFAVLAILGMYWFSGVIGAMWLLIIFGPELARIPQRIQQGRDEPLAARAYEADEAYARGELEQALSLSAEVLQSAETPALRAPMIRLQRAALSKLGRPGELLDLAAAPGTDAMPPLMRARALASVGRLAEAESEARHEVDNPEAGALVAELLVAQDLDDRAASSLAPESSVLLARRVAALEALDPARANRLAHVILDADNASEPARSLAQMSMGQPPALDGLNDRDRWLMETEWAARTADPAGFEQAVRAIPDTVASYVAQQRLHLIGRYDHAARLGSVSGSDARAQYLLARSFARMGELDQAITALDNAVSAGWKDAPETVTEPDLMPLHGHREWRNLLQRMAADSR